MVLHFQSVNSSRGDRRSAIASIPVLLMDVMFTLVQAGTVLMDVCQWLKNSAIFWFIAVKNWPNSHGSVNRGDKLTFAPNMNLVYVTVERHVDSGSN